jgi:hypothetical protein
MENGFRVILLGVVLAVAVFAGFSVWPNVVGMLSDSGPRPVANTALASVAPAVTSPQLNRSAPAAAAAPAQPASYTFLQEKEKTPPRRWLYANGNVILRKEPDGQAFVPLTASFAPLTVHSGTRLWPVRTDADWVLVQSPGKTLGWVHKDEVFTDPYGRSGTYSNTAGVRRPY